MKSRNANLDALRGAAVLMVLGRHFGGFPLWTRIGWAGVDLFFVLSGFLISGLLFSEWKDTGTIDIRRFWIRRAFKIYPAFYVLLFITLTVVWLWPGFTPNPVNARSVFAESVFLQNYLPNVWGHTWSLAVEEHFYLALPLVLWAMQRRPGQDPFRAVPALFAMTAVAALLFRTCGGAENGYKTYLEPTHLRIDSLMSGVALGYYRHFHPGVFGRFARSPAATAAIAVAAAMVFLFPLETSPMHTVGFSAVFVGCCSLLAKVVDRRPIGWERIAIAPLATIGTCSYSIYLWHMAASRIVPGEGAAALALYCGLSIGLGIVMARLTEHPALRLREQGVPRTGRRPPIQQHSGVQPQFLDPGASVRPASGCTTPPPQTATPVRIKA